MNIDVQQQYLLRAATHLAPFAPSDQAPAQHAMRARDTRNANAVATSSRRSKRAVCNLQVGWPRVGRQSGGCNRVRRATRRSSGAVLGGAALRAAMANPQNRRHAKYCAA